MSNEQPEESEIPEQPDADPSAEDLRGVVADISSHYPPPRLGTELVLLEVNPHRAHAYWNIDVEDFRAAQKRTGLEHAPLVLRLYDITDGTPPERAITAFDIEIQGLQGHWYVDLWKDGRTHVADLGFRDASGRLVPLARSNPVSTPSASPSPDYHTAALDTAQGQATDLAAEPALPVVAGDSPVRPEPLVSAGIPELPQPPPLNAPAEHLNEDVQAYFDRAAEALPPVSAAEPAGWPSAERLQELVPAGGGPGPAEQPAVPPGPGPAAGPGPGQQEAPPAPEAPDPEPPRPGSSPTSLDQYVGLSSFEQGRRVVALEVNVELHLYGRAKPGTELTLYGQPVPLGPDGTFSVRKPLPHGAVVLPLLAVDPPARKD